MRIVRLHRSTTILHASMSSPSPNVGEEADAVERRQANSILEAMIDEVFEDADDVDDDPRHAWVIPASGETVSPALNAGEDDDDEDEDDDDGDDDGGEYDPDYDDEVDEDDDLYIDVDEDEMDEVDEMDEDEEGDEDEDDDGAMAIDLSAFLQAAASAGAQNETNEQASRMARMLNGIGLEGLRRLLNTGHLQFRRAADDDDDDDQDDEDSGPFYGGAGSASRRTTSAPMSQFWDPITEPIAAGSELLLGGEFKRPPSRPIKAARSAFEPSRNLASRIASRRYAQRRLDKHELAGYVPNTDGTEVARYPARCYIGQYSQDSSFFYTCTQDFQVHMYDTTVSPYKKVHRNENAGARSRFHQGNAHLTSLRSIKTIQGRHGSWTITDANLSPDNQWMIYSSITPYVYLVPTRQGVESSAQNDNQVMLDFSNQGSDDAGVRYRSGIWSIRFSGDSREIVAGAHFGDIYVYDIEARRRVLKVEGHSDDVNGVAFADSASSNVLISGSDDSFVKVWDRRSLSGGKPAGVLPGHTEGITYVAPKGDGRYCISNGKDQSVKLWDLRKLVSSSDFDRMPSKDFGLRQWDYRNMYYKKPRYAAHPQDCSVMTYRGHAVLRTLIRCHFSPEATTGQKYVYSGSADGRIHIWSLDGRVVQVLDRSKAIPLCRPGSIDTSDPSAPVPSSSGGQEADAGRADGEQSAGLASRGVRRGMWSTSSSPEAITVRDVSWHSSEPALMSTAWDGPDGQTGSIAKHEWKGYGKNGLSLEDAIEKSIAEAAR